MSNSVSYPETKLNLTPGEKDEMVKLGILSPSEGFKSFKMPDFHNDRPPITKKAVHAPNVLNEAMYAGLAIVTTDLVAVIDTLDEKMALFIEKNSPDAIIDKLLYINSNRGLCVDLAMNAHAHLISSYSGDVVYAELLKIYDEVVREVQLA